MLICIYIFYRIILCLTRKIKWSRTKKNEFSTWIFIKFDRFFFQRAIDHLEEIRDQDTVGNFHRRDERENMCHHWEEGKKKKNLSERYLSPRSINSYTNRWKDVDRDGGQEAVGKGEEAVQLERRADRVSNTLEICLGSLPLLLRFRWLEKPAMVSTLYPKLLRLYWPL